MRFVLMTEPQQGLSYLDQVAIARRAETNGFEAFFRFTAEHPALYRIIRQAEFVSPEILQLHYERLTSGYVAGLRQAMEAGEIDDAARIPEYVSQAFHRAVNGRTGPVVLALPEDMLTDRVDVADAGLPHGRGDDEVERPFEAYHLDRRVRQRFGLLERRNRGIRIGGRILPGLDRRLDESAHRVRVLLGEGRGGEQHVGVEVDAMVAQHDDVDVVALHARGAQAFADLALIVRHSVRRG